MSQESQSEEYLLKNNWQKVHNGLNTGYFLPSARRFCNSLQEAFGFQLAMDAVRGSSANFEMKVEPVSKIPINDDDEKFLQVDVPNEDDEVEPEDVETKTMEKPVTPLKRKSTLATSSPIKKETEIKRVKNNLGKLKSRNNTSKRVSNRGTRKKIQAEPEQTANNSRMRKTRNKTVRVETPANRISKKTVTLRRSPNSSFNAIWHSLKELGWTYFNGDALTDYFYAPPGVKKKSDGVRGKTLFTGAEAYEYLFEHKSELLGKIEEGKGSPNSSSPESITSEFSNTIIPKNTVSKNLIQDFNLHAEEEVEKIDPLNLVVKDCRRFFNRVIWPILQKDHMWEYFKSKDSLGNTYVFVASEFDKSSKTFDRDSGLIFIDGEHFVEYALKLENGSKELSEWDQMLLDYFQEGKIASSKDGEDLVCTRDSNDNHGTRSRKSRAPQQPKIKQSQMNLRKNEHKESINLNINNSLLNDDNFSVESVASESGNSEVLPIPSELQSSMKKILSEENELELYSDLVPCFTTELSVAVLENSSRVVVDSDKVGRIQKFVNDKVQFRKDDIEEIINALVSPILTNLYMYITSKKGEGKSKVLRCLQDAFRNFNKTDCFIGYEKDNKAIFRQVIAILQTIIHEEENEFRTETDERRFQNALEMKMTFEKDNLNTQLKNLLTKIRTNEQWKLIIFFIDGSVPEETKQIVWLQQYLLNYKIDLRIVHAESERKTSFQQNPSNALCLHKLKPYTSSQRCHIVMYELAVIHKKQFKKALLNEIVEQVSKFTSNIAVIVEFILNNMENLEDVNQVISKFKADIANRSGFQAKNVDHLTKQEKLMVVAAYLCSVNTPKQNHQLHSNNSRTGQQLVVPVDGNWLNKFHIHSFTEYDLSMQFKRMSDQMSDLKVDEDTHNWKYTINQLSEFIAYDTNSKLISTISESNAKCILESIEYPTALKNLVAH